MRRFTVTTAAAHDGAQLGAVLDPANTASSVWADAGGDHDGPALLHHVQEQDSVLP